MILECGVTTPKALIVAVRDGMDDFVYPNDTVKDDINTHADHSEDWCFRVMMKLLPGVTINL
jgi:hypothetical protein